MSILKVVPYPKVSYKILPIYQLFFRSQSVTVRRLYFRPLEGRDDFDLKILLLPLYLSCLDPHHYSLDYFSYCCFGHSPILFVTSFHPDLRTRHRHRLEEDLRELGHSGHAGRCGSDPIEIHRTGRVHTGNITIFRRGNRKRLDHGTTGVTVERSLWVPSWSSTRSRGRV